MKRLSVICATMMLLGAGLALADTKTLRQLEARCEQARLAKLEPAREQMARECVRKEGKSLDQCRRFYSTWGDGAPGRPPMFNDLPECVKATQYAQQYRSR